MNTSVHQGTLDGYTENLMIKGNEFENIITDNRAITGNPNTDAVQFSYDTSKIPSGTSEWTLFFNISRTTIDQGDFDNLYVSIETFGGTNRLTQQYPIGEGMGKIYKNITIDTNLSPGSQVNQTKIIFYTEIQNKEITVQDVMLIKGTYHKNIPYFEGKKKLGPNLHIISHNKNLTPKLEEGSIDPNTGELQDSSFGAIRFKDFVRVTPHTDYTFTSNFGQWRTMIIYDINKKAIDHREIEDQSKKGKKSLVINTGPKGYYIKCRVEGIDKPYKISDAIFQLEIGNHETSYVEPKMHIKDIKLPQGLGSDQVLLFDKEYGRSVIKKVISTNPFKLGETVAITDLYDIEMKTYDNQTWFTILDDGVFADSLLGSIAYDYEIDPEYDPLIESKHYIYILKSGDMIDGKLYKTVEKMQSGKSDLIKFTDSFYGYPDKYVLVKDIIRILKQHI